MCPCVVTLRRTHITPTPTLRRDTSQYSDTTHTMGHDKTHIMGQDTWHLINSTPHSAETHPNTVTQEIWDMTRNKTHIKRDLKLSHSQWHSAEQRHIAYSDTKETYCGIHIMGHDKTRDTNYWIWQDTRDTYHGIWQDKWHILWNMTIQETPLRHTYFETLLWDMTSKNMHNCT